MLVGKSVNRVMYSGSGNESGGYRAQPCAEPGGRRVALQECFGRRPKGSR
jgi:hypothetical protein